ncbi:hypothetical protein WN55_05789 [Dufourea novaeangliae]|uniref:Uncharacterized protein n=1 Tax=Dufourea novaeangliae TaxID=178035 RepID=A0A154P089_DUFNO|nr:hypothetical protein WN55_05789 [Dufourea novaeangliae]
MRVRVEDRQREREGKKAVIKPEGCVVGGGGMLCLGIKKEDDRDSEAHGMEADDNVSHPNVQGGFGDLGGHGDLRGLGGLDGLMDLRPQKFLEFLGSLGSMESCQLMSLSGFTVSVLYLASIGLASSLEDSLTVLAGSAESSTI